jgi:hypothetical protein
MSFKSKYPQFAPIEQHIRRANAERAVYLAALITDAVVAVIGGLRRLMPASAPAARAPRARKPLVVKARFVETVRG